VPVVSVGNLVAGGTGKTPFVAWLVARLRAAGRRPGVLARGYGPRPPGADVSDEGVLLRRLLGPDVPYVEDPRRLRGGRTLLARHPATDLLVLDDGFQHRALARDLDVVLLDVTNPFGFGHRLPRGILREDPSALGRAGAVVLTRCERATPADLDALQRRVAAWTRAPVARARTRAVGVERDGRRAEPASLAGERVHACSAIGNPAAFAALLEDLGAVVVGRSEFPDHALLSANDWEEVLRAAEREAARVVVTRKDAVKHAALPPSVAVLDVETEVVAGADALWAAVLRVASG
jgi:tetraacyldisaccharide 4'-kinase